MLFSGTDNHIAGLGQMAEHMQPQVDYKSHPGYEGYLNFRVAAVSEILQDAGYNTCMSGKWHLGLSPETAPHARGFDDSFTFLSGCHNHYNYEPQLDEPKHGLFTPMNGGKFWMRDDKYLDRKTEISKDFYSTDSFTDELLAYFDKRSTNRDLSEKPFFAYLPYTAPHWPLQAPRELIDKYKGKYDEGPHVLKEQRLQRLKDLGIVAKDVTPAPMDGYSDKSDIRSRLHSKYHHPVRSGVQYPVSAVRTLRSAWSQSWLHLQRSRIPLSFLHMVLRSRLRWKNTGGD